MSAPRYILLAKFCDDVGYTIKAIERKIESGVWREGFQYRRSPDGRIQVDLENYERWVEGQQAPLRPGTPPSGSSSRGRAAA
jgi:hypothetical protein